MVQPIEMPERSIKKKEKKEGTNIYWLCSWDHWAWRVIKQPVERQRVNDYG